MPQQMQDAINYSRRWIDLIHRPEVTEQDAKSIIEESMVNFAEHFNRGGLEYRKSVT